MHDSAELRFALSAVAEAAHLVRQVQQEMVTPALTKGDRSPVTIGDFAAQAVVAWRLKEAFPGDPLVGEESAAALREAAGEETLQQVTGFVKRRLPDVSADDVCELIDLGCGDAAGRFWTLDPIDGTKGFLRGEQYVVALALIEGGEVKLGVLACPELTPDGREEMGGRGALFAATAGGGAWSAAMDAAERFDAFSSVHVSTCTDVRQARLLRSVEASHTHGDKIDDLAKLLDIQANPVRMDSQAKYALLAAGGGEVLLRLISPSRPDYREKIWDQAAGSLVITEAGGRVTDLDDQPLDFRHGRALEKNRGVLATNGRLHEVLLQALRDVGA